MNMNDLDWDKLRVIRAVAEAGTMSGAAVILHETAATVSRKIDDVEHVLGSQLFTRSSRGVELTAAGRTALRFINIMADAAEALHSDVAGADGSAEGDVNIVAGDGLGAHWIAPHLPAFHREIPGIHLQITISDNVANLQDEGFDLGVQFNPPTNRDLISKKLGTLHYMFFASRPYLDVYGAPASPQELLNHRCISHIGYVNQPSAWPEKAGALGELIDFSILTNSGAVMREICAAGGGLAILPSYFTDVDERLIALPLGGSIPIDFWLVYPERTRRIERGRIVLNWIRQIFDTERYPWFRPTFVSPLDASESHCQTTPQHAESL